MELFTNDDRRDQLNLYVMAGNWLGLVGKYVQHGTQGVCPIGDNVPFEGYVLE